MKRGSGGKEELKKQGSVQYWLKTSTYNTKKKKKPPTLNKNEEHKNGKKNFFILIRKQKIFIMEYFKGYSKQTILIFSNLRVTYFDS